MCFGNKACCYGNIIVKGLCVDKDEIEEYNELNKSNSQNYKC